MRGHDGARHLSGCILARRDLEVSALDASLELDPEMSFEIGELLPELLEPERIVGPPIEG
jgi:hypothetical protein